jgi:hypothetical protein
VSGGLTGVSVGWADGCECRVGARGSAGGSIDDSNAPVLKRRQDRSMNVKRPASAAPTRGASARAQLYNNRAIGHGEDASGVPLRLMEAGAKFSGRLKH